MRLPPRRQLTGLAALLLVALSACSSSPGPGAASHRPTSSRGTTSTSPAPAGSPDQSVAGTPGWEISNAGAPSAIQGYADHASVSPGQAVRLFVSTTAPGYTVTAYRMGAYRGSSAREVWRSGHLTATPQPAAVMDPKTLMASAPWKPSLTVQTTGWEPGAYLFRLDSDAKFQRYVPLTVLSPSAAGRVVFMNAVTTWQAYNSWGGANLYRADATATKRAVVVSFDRPYSFGDGAADFVGNELPVLLLADRLGLPLAFTTSVDVDRDAHALDGARALISTGHDEYWSLGMRQHVTTARDAGMNIAFFGANAIYRHIRLQPSPLGPGREEVNYRDSSGDPLHAKDSYDTTEQWRMPPHPRPESVLTGALYECSGVKADLVAADNTSWLTRGIVNPGDRLAGLVGNEYDRVTLTAPTPRPIEALFRSPLRCGGKASFADTTWYAAPSGAGVFDASTSAWVAYVGAPGHAGDVITAITTRLLQAIGQGPAGRSHPAQDNLVALKIPGATPAPASPTVPAEPLRP